MQKGRRLEGVIRPLAPQLMARDAMQLVVKKRQQLLQRIRIAAAPLLDEFIGDSVRHQGIPSLAAILIGAWVQVEKNFSAGRFEELIRRCFSL
jgi:hypothetical protein